MHYKTFIKRNAMIERWQAEGATGASMVLYRTVIAHTDQHGVYAPTPEERTWTYSNYTPRTEQPNAQPS